MTREDLRNALLKKDNKFATNYIVVANTYMNISFEFKMKLYFILRRL